ncbi:MAG: YihY family inner membrane protein [Bacteroidia bacterium]|nr:YihY family inner membrane protein [Bacteroidia bacterium]
MINILKKIWLLLTKNLWNVRLEKINNPYIRSLVKEIRTFNLAIKGFTDDKCLTKATALTYYTLFSIVPVLAVAFAIANGFGFQKYLQKQLLQKYGEYSEVLNNAFIYADALLATTKGGLIAGFGILLLLWSVINLLINIENSFNEIWEVKKGRNWSRKLTDYTTIIVLSPIFFIISGSFSVIVQSGLSKVYLIGKFNVILIELIAWLIMVMIFTLIFKVLPNTKVEFKSAFKAAIVTLILFEVVKWAYIKFQIGVNRYNAIYGGFAALPLFLIWVQYSWYIILFGAELSYAHQNSIHFEMERESQNMSNRFRKILSVLVMHQIIKAFQNKNSKLPGIADLSEKLDLPLRITRIILNDLLETGLVTESQSPDGSETRYVPGFTDENMTLWEVWNAIEAKGENEIPIAEIENKKTVIELINKAENTLQTQMHHIKIKDL